MKDHAAKIVQAEGLCSVSNNTKWLRVVEGMRLLGCEVRVKYIDQSEPTSWHAGVWAPHPRYLEGAAAGPSEFKFVEWLEYRAYGEEPRGRLVEPTRMDRSREIERVLLASKADFERLEDCYRVYGYRRSGRTGTAAEPDV